MHHLDELGAVKDGDYFQYAISDRPAPLELHVPTAERAATTLGLAERLAPRRVIWRHDLRIVSKKTDID